VLAIRFCSNCPLLLLPEYTRPFAISSTYIAPEHLPNLPLPLVLDIIRVEELRYSNFPRTPLSCVIPRLHPALVAPANPIPLIIGPREVLLCPLKAYTLIFL